MKVYILTRGRPEYELHGVCGCFTSLEAAVQTVRNRHPDGRIEVREHPHNKYVTWIEVELPQFEEIQDYIVEEYSLMDQPSPF